MNGKFLLDTNVIIGYLKGLPGIVSFMDTRQEPVFYASVITRMELLSFPGIAAEEEALIKKFMSSLTILPLSEPIENTAVNLRRATRSQMPDAIIAATAIILGATLVTCDRDLAAMKFPGLHTAIPEN